MSQQIRHMYSIVIQYANIEYTKIHDGSHGQQSTIFCRKRNLITGEEVKIEEGEFNTAFEKSVNNPAYQNPKVKPRISLEKKHTRLS